MRPEPLVSVVIPAYNRAGVLGRAIESVLAQTHGNFELLIIDDGSTDRTASVAAGFGDSRIKYHAHHKNQGASAARNTGMGLARGEYVAILDSDDEWLAEKLRLQVEMLQSRTVDACGCGFLHLREDGAERLICPPDIREGWFRQLLDGCTICGGSTLMFRRDYLSQGGLFDTTIVRFDDWDWSLRYCAERTLGMVTRPLAVIHNAGWPSYEKVTRDADLLARRLGGLVAGKAGAKGLKRFKTTLAMERGIAAYKQGKRLTALAACLPGFAASPSRALWAGRRLIKPVNPYPCQSPPQ